MLFVAWDSTVEPSSRNFYNKDKITWYQIILYILITSQNVWNGAVPLYFVLEICDLTYKNPAK